MPGILPARILVHQAVDRVLSQPTPELLDLTSRYLDLLLRYKADINCRDDQGVTPLYRALLYLRRENSRPVIELLLAKGARRDLFFAAATGDVALAEKLLKKKLQRARQSLTGGATPLHFAARWGAHDVARRLLDAGATTQARDDQGATPLHLAGVGFRPGQAEVVELLLAHPHSINARDDNGLTPLHYASQLRDNESNIPVQLLAKGAFVDARSDAGETPLHFAARAGNQELCELFLSHGADLLRQIHRRQNARRTHPPPTLRTAHAWFERQLSK